MVKAANAILGYEHYPHDDVYTTGVRGCRLLLKAARGEARPVIGHAKLPLLLTGFNASTAWDTPFAQLMKEAKALEGTPGILSTSMFLVGSYIDIPDMGCSSVVVADANAAMAVREAEKLAESFWTRRRDSRLMLTVLRKRLNWAEKSPAARYCSSTRQIPRGAVRRGMASAW